MRKSKIRGGLKNSKNYGIFLKKIFYVLENFVKRGYIFVNINYLYKLFV